MWNDKPWKHDRTKKKVENHNKRTSPHYNKILGPTSPFSYWMIKLIRFSSTLLFYITWCTDFQFSFFFFFFLIYFQHLKFYNTCDKGFSVEDKKKIYIYRVGQFVVCERERCNCEVSISSSPSLSEEFVISECACMRFSLSVWQPTRCLRIGCVRCQYISTLHVFGLRVYATKWRKRKTGWAWVDEVVFLSLLCPFFFPFLFVTVKRYFTFFPFAFFLYF